MKIDAIDITLFAWDDIPPTRYTSAAQNRSGRSNLGLLRIATDAGIDGYAFLGSATNPAETDAAGLIRFLKPVLIGKDPLAREGLHAAMRAYQRNLGLRAVGACDTALWDIAAKAAGMPLYAFLGGARSSIGAYASSQVLEAKEAYAAEAAEFKAQGWKAYKIHPPHGAEEDIRVCEAVRGAVGDDYTLMLDSTWSYRYADAVRVGRAIERMGYLWFEDPLNEEDIYSYVKLRQKLDIPILATEYPIGGLDAYIPWITERATDFLRGDVAVKGGITTLVKTAHLAEAFRMNMEVHHGGNSLNNVANLHVIMAIRNTEFFEVLLPDAMQKYGLVEDITVDRDGLVHAPTEPGLGAQIDFELIERKKVGVLS